MLHVSCCTFVLLLFERQDIVDRIDVNHFGEFSCHDFGGDETKSPCNMTDRGPAFAALWRMDCANRISLRFSHAPPGSQDI